MSGQVFISYSRADRAYVEKLATFLEAAGIRCWYDHELAAGDRWGHVLRAEIDRCAAFMVVMTPAAEESKWVSRELARADGRRKPIFPLLLAGEPFFELSEVQFENVTGERLPGASIVNRLRSLVTVDSTPTSPPLSTVRSTAPRVSGRLLHTLTGHDATFVEWSPDGTRLATTSIGRATRIWNTVTGDYVHTLKRSGVPLTSDLFAAASSGYGQPDRFQPEERARQTDPCQH